METLKLTFVNVGYGEAILLECPDPQAQDGVFVMVIDGGSAEPEEYALRATGRVSLTEELRRRGLSHIDCMVNTHIHEDHTCGLLSAARAWSPHVLWQTLPKDFYRCMTALDPERGTTPSQKKFIRALNDYRAVCAESQSVRALCAGDSGLLCPGLRYQVLAPTKNRCRELEAALAALYECGQESEFIRQLTVLDAAMNNFSLILRLEYGPTAVLLPGDTNRAGYGEIPQEELRAAIFKVGHHGQKDGVSQKLVEMIRPEATICCASSDRRYESAHPDALRVLANAGSKLYFSDCPQVSDFTENPPPHRALEFLLERDGSRTAHYIHV